MPIRVRRSRTKGSKLPPNTVCVTRPGIFGNPFLVAKAEEAGYRNPPDNPNALAEWCVSLFRQWLVSVGDPVPAFDGQRAKLLAALPTLRGKNLACFCLLDAPCHADVLLLFANGGGL